MDVRSSTAYAALHKKENTFYIHNDEVVIGRGEGLLINLPDPYVSRKHCVIRRKDCSTFTICDLSFAGTFLNGTRLHKHIPVNLSSSDRISIMGRYSFEFTINKKRWKSEIEVLKRKLKDSEDKIARLEGTKSELKQRRLFEEKVLVQKTIADCVIDLTKDTNTFDKENQDTNKQVQEKVKEIKKKLEEHKQFKSEVENLEQGLLCGICKEVYIDPYVLNCHHSFCEVCIDEWIKQRQYCPVCRKYTISCTKAFFYNKIIPSAVNMMTVAGTSAVPATPLQEQPEPGPSRATLVTQPSRRDQFESNQLTGPRRTRTQPSTSTPVSPIPRFICH